MSVFASDRLFVLPFEKHFSESERDKTLKRKFCTAETQSAILNWLIEGYRLYVAEGLQPPESVKSVTAQFEKDSDKIQLFIDDCFEENPNGEIRIPAAFATYQEWTQRNGFRQPSSRTFRADIESHFEIAKNKRPRDGGNPTTLILGYVQKNLGDEKPW
jgi:putative DNA primase/helicase